ncbi:odorant receptor 30a [Aethina tumida]|uniref:odorant receptor 30a n=1 Tax=Aethina tumida TaxID=116153 RepID=UPI0021481786|nr:odorant receptor 30a [Aethina tumida]
MDDPEVLSESLSYIALYIIMFVSLMYIQSKSVQRLFKQIDEMEETIFKMSNKNIKDIYGKYSRINIVAGKQIFYVLGAMCFCLGVHHLKILERKHSFIYYQWYPIDTEKYYWFVAFNQSCFLTVAFFYMAYTKLSPIAFSTYILGRIKVLQHILVGLDDYAKLQPDQDIHESRFRVIKKCVSMHNDVIEYVTLIRSHTSTFIMLDFMLSSFQLGSALIVLMSNDQNIRLVDKSILLWYLLINIYIMWVTYYYGNEIIVQSLNVSVLAYNKLNWYDFSPKCKLALIMIMAKAQTPLAISIGPLADLSLQAFLTVIRATFSYMTFIKSIYE